jgi:Phosphoesterase family
MPEALLKAGVSWKVYNDPTGILGLGVLSYFKNYTDPFSITDLELIGKGLAPTYPGDFHSDVKNGTLPSVSWIVPPLAECEHPAAPPEWGEYLTTLPSSAGGIAGPIGLGFRTPCLVILDRQQPHGRRGGGPQRPDRHPGRRHPLPAPDVQQDAVPGNDAVPPAGPVAVRFALAQHRDHSERTRGSSSTTRSA